MYHFTTTNEFFVEKLSVYFILAGYLTQNILSNINFQVLGKIKFNFSSEQIFYNQTENIKVVNLEMEPEIVTDVGKKLNQKFPYVPSAMV